MKILYITKLKRSNETNMSQWQVVHIINELESNGSEINLFYPYGSFDIENRNKKILEYAKLTNPDFVLSYFNENELLPETLLQLRKIGIPSVLICFDNLVIPFEHKKIAKHYDLVWLTSQETEYLFKRWGAKTIVLPYAANPKIEIRHSLSQAIYRVAFVGTPYGARKELLRKFSESDLPIDIYGKIDKSNRSDDTSISENIWNLMKLLSFPIGRRLLTGTLKYRFFANKEKITGTRINLKNPVPVGEVPSIYAKYALSLSSTSARNTEVLENNVPIVNLRSFEIPMFYGIQICRYNNELASYFEENKEILFYRDKSEMIEKVKYYTQVSHEKEIQKMKLAARKRAECDHTWTKRFNEIYDTLFR